VDFSAKIFGESLICVGTKEKMDHKEEDVGERVE
jgi:hypothetical protein